MTNNSKTRNYVSIGYPESLKENWLDTLRNTHIQCVISPLHNQDILDIKTGELKKEHYHILLMFDNTKTLKHAQDIFDSIGAINCEPVNSLRGQARYLCHLDELDKHIYDINDVICLNGVDYISLINQPSNQYQLIKEMMFFCKDNSIIYFNQLLEYAALNRQDWYIVLCKNGSYVMDKYIKSLDYQLKNSRGNNDE